MNKFFPSSSCESLRKCVIPHTTEPVEAARRAVDDVATMGEDELNDRRQLVQASGLAVGQRCAAVSALRPHAHHHDTMSSLPLLGRACAHSVRYHYHLLMDPDCAGIRSLSSEMRSRRLGLITERTGDRPLAAWRLHSSPTACGIKAATTCREYDLFLRASFSRVRRGHRVHRSGTL